MLENMESGQSRAPEVNHTPAALLAQAKADHQNGRLQEARSGYEAVLRLDPQNFDASHMLGVLALQMGDPRQAIAHISHAVHLRPQDAQAQANLGTACSFDDRPEEALQAYARALAIQPRFAGVWRNRGTILQRLGRHEEAAEAFQSLLDLAPTFDFARGSLFESRRYSCDWRDYGRQAGAIIDGTRAGAHVDRPFSFLSVTGSAADQYQCATLNTAYLCSGSPLARWRGERYPHERIRVAYVSADFREHVVLRLMAPLLERHDRQRFQVIGVSLVAQDGSELLNRARSSLAQFVDASRFNDDQVADALRELEVDIAVDLTGYTAGSRPGIFARRPAPVQVNMLGFPGTMGAPFMDYIIADSFVAPDSSREFFSERIVHMPDTFQIAGQHRALAAEPHAPTRREAGLPEAGVVLCAFNNSYKLNPDMLDVWGRVLRAVPESVLWLLGDGSAVERHLRDEAAARGIAPQRLVFAPRVGYQDHLARLGLADLFLDTLPFNAGATAADSLWSGVPILTCAGESLASRMAGSALGAIGLPELITFNLRDYESLALALAGDRAKLAQLRSRLAANRHTHALFDVNRYCRHLESAYAEMWARVQRGEGPAHFAVRPID